MNHEALTMLADKCGARNAYPSSPKITFDTEAWRRFTEALASVDAAPLSMDGFILGMLVAAGWAPQAKVDEARAIAALIPRAAEQGKDTT